MRDRETFAGESELLRRDRRTDAELAVGVLLTELAMPLTIDMGIVLLQSAVIGILTEASSQR